MAITLNEGDELVWGKVTTGKDNIMLITHDGKSIRFSEIEVKTSQRDTKGVKGITLKAGDYVIGVEVFRDDPEVFKENSLMIITENGMGKRTLLEQNILYKKDLVWASKFQKLLNAREKLPLLNSFLTGMKKL